MTASIVAVASERQVARPLHVLVPLIKKDLADAKEAADSAAKPYYQAAGEKMLEAQGQMKRGEWAPWLRRNFPDVSERQARRYIEAATNVAMVTNGRGRGPLTMSDAIREGGGSPRGAAYGGAAWREPIRGVLDRVDTERLNIRQEELKRAEEREVQRTLALQLIDIGYKALATKLHPDKKGGSREAMTRLNQVRERLKGAA